MSKNGLRKAMKSGSSPKKLKTLRAKCRLHKYRTYTEEDSAITIDFKRNVVDTVTKKLGWK